MKMSEENILNINGIIEEINKDTNEEKETPCENPTKSAIANNAIIEELREVKSEGKELTSEQPTKFPFVASYPSNSKVNSDVQKIPATPEKKYQSIVNGSLSPDLFEEEHEQAENKVQSVSSIKGEKYIIRKDRAVLRKAQNHLKGVLPPHSVTTIHMSVDEMLNKIEINKDYFWNSNSTEQDVDTVIKTENDGSFTSSINKSNDSGFVDSYKSLLLTCAIEECLNRDFPHILEDRCHGLYHNRSKLSEEFEDICAKYAQRYVGAETQSTCTVFEVNCLSPVKRKQMKQRWAVKSPGRRLSHLARRRITFSSVNLQNASSSFTGSRARQILVDAKKLDLLNRKKSPKKTPKKTPAKSPRTKTRTPSSSAKKKLAMRFRKLTGEIEKTSTPDNTAASSNKWALFPSPDCDKKSSLFLMNTSAVSTFENDVKKPSTKRALFVSPSKHSQKDVSPFKRSPFKRSPFKRLDLGDDKKRKRTDSEDFQPSKLARSLSMDVRGTETERKSFDRTKSDTIICQNRNVGGELSAVHKKKLQWAVYEALRSQNVTPAHPQFKLFASILARLTRRFLPNLGVNAPRPEGGTSDRMLRIARHHVYSVIKGKSVDEIYNEYVKGRTKHLKPHGYISLEHFVADKKETNKENTSLYEEVRGSLQKKLSDYSGSSNSGCGENKIERIRKVINFGDEVQLSASVKFL